MFTSILEPSHLIIILIVALVLLGPRRLPEAESLDSLRPMYYAVS
jgi:Sec-independent protein translocase protein TatA